MTEQEDLFGFDLDLAVRALKAWQLANPTPYDDLFDPTRVVDPDRIDLLFDVAMLPGKPRGVRHVLHRLKRELYWLPAIRATKAATEAIFRFRDDASRPLDALLDEPTMPSKLLRNAVIASFGEYIEKMKKIEDCAGQLRALLRDLDEDEARAWALFQFDTAAPCPPKQKQRDDLLVDLSLILRRSGFSNAEISVLLDDGKGTNNAKERVAARLKTRRLKDLPPVHGLVE